MYSRIFTTENQNAFAKLSGDFNPLHIDIVSARRLLFGSTVVHGIHSLLWALDCWLNDKNDFYQINSLKVTFPKPIRVGEKVSLSVKSVKGNDLKIILNSGDSIVTRIKVNLIKIEKLNIDKLNPSFPEKLPARLLNDLELEKDSGSLEMFFHVETMKKLFPNLVRCVSGLQIAEIISTTRLVGMKCPGKNSIFSELHLSRTLSNANKGLNYEVVELDKRFKLLDIKIDSPEMTGYIKAFNRPEPLEQASYLDIKKQIENCEFADQRALIIGGSRGIGEVATKLLCAGGADVKFTYFRGKEDAQAIVDDIVLNGGNTDYFQYDVLNPLIDSQVISKDTWFPTHLYYFATPFIFSGLAGKFSFELFTKFCAYYIEGFLKTVNLLKESDLKFIFHPSSVAVSELPTDMGEYSAAKLAGETLCSFIEKTQNGVTVYKPRFPRMATDQTVSVAHVTNHDPVPILLNELRLFRDFKKQD